MITKLISVSYFFHQCAHYFFFKSFDSGCQSVHQQSRIQMLSEPFFFFIENNWTKKSSFLVFDQVETSEQNELTNKLLKRSVQLLKSKNKKQYIKKANKKTKIYSLDELITNFPCQVKNIIIQISRNRTRGCFYICFFKCICCREESTYKFCPQNSIWTYGILFLSVVSDCFVWV